jgi:hypothetical protein
LDGLGATEGPSVTCNWTTAGLVPQFLPWLAVLALLVLKPNRGWSAWWIGLPLAGVAAVCHYLKLASQGSPNGPSGETVGLLCGIPMALAFGLAALWLLAPYLGGHRPLRTVLGIVAILATFMVFSFAAMAGWGLVAEPLASLLDPRHCASTANVGAMAWPFLVPLVLPAPVVALAMAFCGLACRGRYRPLGLYLWFFLSLLAVWLAVSGLVYAWCQMARPGSVDYAPFLGIGLSMLVVTFATTLPFLILSSASPLFRARLQALLQVKPKMLPAMGAAASLQAAAQFD